MSVKEVLRPLPGVRRLSLLRQQLSFPGSAAYWERNYARGGTSGSGSYGGLARGKAAFLNAFVAARAVRSVTEFGCGDGHQLSLARYPRYLGLDVSPAAISLCRRRFGTDLTKSFFRYDGGCFVDNAGLFRADLALSLDVIYHLVEDEVFETYLTHLFGAGQRFVVIYATNAELSGTAPHVRHRRFTGLVARRFPGWQLSQVARGPNDGPGRADFFVYQPAGQEQLS
jgi:SAM-dependent methyltransferase